MEVAMGPYDGLEGEESLFVEEILRRGGENVSEEIRELVESYDYMSSPEWRAIRQAMRMS